MVGLLVGLWGMVTCCDFGFTVTWCILHWCYANNMIWGLVICLWNQLLAVCYMSIFPSMYAWLVGLWGMFHEYIAINVCVWLACEAWWHVVTSRRNRNSGQSLQHVILDPLVCQLATSLTEKIFQFFNAKNESCFKLNFSASLWGAGHNCWNEKDFSAKLVALHITAVQGSSLVQEFKEYRPDVKESILKVMTPIEIETIYFILSGLVLSSGNSWELKRATMHHGATSICIYIYFLYTPLSFFAPTPKFFCTYP